MLYTLVIQLTIMRRLEKFLGWFRIIIIYTVCGMAANVFSAIFLPYFVTVRLHAVFKVYSCLCPICDVLLRLICAFNVCLIMFV